MSTKIEIPISKTKTALLIFFPLFIGVIGVFAFLSPESFVSNIHKSSDYICTVGIAAAGLSLVLFILIIRKWIIKKTGLIIDNDGITDISNGTYTELIEWRDIAEIKKVKTGPLKAIVLLTDQPEKYINKAKKGLRPSMQKTYKFHGSPLMLVASRLKIKYDDLAALITNEFEKSKHNAT